MKIIIVGAGVVGTHLAKQLIAQGHEVVVVDSDESVVFQLKNRLDCLVVHDEGNNARTLERVGAPSADFLVTVTHSDELNLLICEMVKKNNGKPVKIARTRNTRYSSPEIYFDNFNIDFIVNPEIESARAVIRSLETNALSDVLEFARASLQIRNITVNEHSLLCNKQVKSIMPLIEIPFLFSLVYRDNQAIIPNGDTIIQKGDVVYIAADSEYFPRIYKAFGITVEQLRKIVIAGGGRMGQLIATHILQTQRQDGFRKRIRKMFHKTDLVIVDKDYHVAQKLAEQFPQALVIHGDISSSDLFAEEDLSSADVLIATTNNEEVNMLSATYGKSIGIKRAMVVVSKTHYPIIAHALKIDATVSIKNTVVNVILKRIHRRHISSIHSLLDGLIEVLELDVGATSRLVNKKLKDVSLPGQCIILNITRHKSSHVPRGEFIIRENDQVIVIVPKEYSEEINRLFRGTIFS